MSGQPVFPPLRGQCGQGHWLRQRHLGPGAPWRSLWESDHLMPSAQPSLGCSTISKENMLSSGATC